MRSRDVAEAKPRRIRGAISPASIVASLVISRIVCIGTYSILCDFGAYTNLIVSYYDCQLFFDQKLLSCDLASAYFDAIILQVCTFPYIIYSHLLFSLFKIDIVLLEYYISNTYPPSVVGLGLLFSAST